MENQSQLAPLLTEIRDLVREQTDLYKEMARRSIENQEQSMAMVRAGQRMYRRLAFVVLIVVALLIVYLVIGMMR
jgi:CHASE3 domain sensor protein